jgi:hypothetical protein
LKVRRAFSSSLVAKKLIPYSEMAHPSNSRRCLRP